MKRWQKISLVPLIPLILLTAYIFWPISNNLAHLASVGDQYNVEILRDTWGVPHIFGQTDADTAYGLGFAHAEDDFLTIQQTALAARGDLATVYGLEAAPNDFMVELLRINEQLEANYDTISPDVIAICEAYADGLNHYAALHEDEALPGLFPLSGRDIIAGSIHKSPLFFGFENTLGQLFAEERQSTLSPRFDNTAVWGNYQNVAGSNAFAVAPSRTENGETFLAINSHQPWEGPVAWYEAHLHSEEGWDMVGGLLPGMPIIGHGHNRDLGWAFTVNSTDLADVFVLEINPDNENQYLFDGEWLDLEVRQAPLEVNLIGRLNWTVKREVLWSVYGPTVRQPHGVYAVRYAAMGQAGIFEQLYRMNKATNYDEWSAAMQRMEMPTFNTVYADREGNIFYLYNGLIPIRDEQYDWQQYLPGHTSETLWTEYLPFEQLPQVFNPPAGFIQNTNGTPFSTTIGLGNPDPARYSPTLGLDLQVTNRLLRSLELFGADESISESDFFAYKFDMGYSAESIMAGFVEKVAGMTAPAGYETAQTLITTWDRQANPQNTSAALAILTYQSLNYKNPAELTPAELENALITTADLLIETYGQLDVTWQTVNRLQRGHIDLGVGGGPDTLHAIYGDLNENNRLVGNAGDSYILLVTWLPDGSVRSQSIHQFGSATLHPTSPHYADQSALFVQRLLKPVWLDEADIRANLERAYRPGQ